MQKDSTDKDKPKERESIGKKLERYKAQKAKEKLTPAQERFNKAKCKAKSNKQKGVGR